jgi:oxygen-independent coproporphyrinogen-3 oxidase
MTPRDPATTVGDPQTTDVGSVFVSNYPPYSTWSPDRVPDVHAMLARPADASVPLGLYLHVPFCRKRCKFCYFKVYTEKNARDVQAYVDALASEVELYAERPAIAGRDLRFVYFGGGTPSFLSGRQLGSLVSRVRAVLPWDAVDEVTFECEPGTLTESKLEMLREIGVTRLSLGVENFDDAILRENGRAHLSHEIYRVLPWIERLRFDQWNLDLIAGMVGETWDTWRVTVEKTIEADPDSVTIYQMELPFNTLYSRDKLGGGDVPVADWKLKREWHDHAFRRLEESGYEVSSAYTMVKRGSGARFVYRDALWHGGDLLGTGVASFSHLQGLHFQNVSGWTPYLERLGAGELPIERAFVNGPEELLIRETILQLKLGRLDRSYFVHKFGVDVVDRFRDAFSALEARGMLSIEPAGVRLTRQGLLRVDTLLPELYAPAYRGARYT